MLATLDTAYLAPDVDATDDEVEALEYMAGQYTQHILGLREYESFDLTVVGECLFAIGSWNALLTPLKSTHYFLNEAMETRDDASDLLIHSSEIQQACKSVLSQMFLIALNIYRLQDDLGESPELLHHMTTTMDKMLEDAGLLQTSVQLELQL